MISVCDPTKISSTKPNILWQHLNTDQYAVHALKSASFVDHLDYIIFVSEWQRAKFCQEFSIPHEKTLVINNAVEPMMFVPKTKSDKIKLIYTSMPFRGLDVLLATFDRLRYPDVELTVFSSNIIYGSDYVRSVGKTYDLLFEQCRQHPKINYRGYALNKAVRQALAESDILAYPSTFEETSCLSAIEAGLMGCKIVTTDLGALPETCGIYADYVASNKSYQILVESYTNALNSAIDRCRSGNFDGLAQHNWFKEKYSWTTQAKTWNKFLEKVSQ